MSQIFAEEYELFMVSAIILFFACTAIGITWFFNAIQTRSSVERFNGVTTTFLGLPSVLFSLTVALMASSLWENYSMANKSVRTESIALQTIIELAETNPNLMPLARYAQTYARSVVQEEWQTLSTRGMHADTTKKHFELLRKATFDAVDELKGNAQATVLMRAIQSLNEARKTRLSYVSFDIHPVRWYVSIILAVLVQITVASIHMSKPKVLPLVMVISTATILLPLCTIAITLSNPYVGLISISSGPFNSLLLNSLN